MLVWMVIAALVLGSALSLLSLLRENFPRIDFQQAKITTIFPGASAVDVEQRVTIPIEEELREIEGLKRVRSVSRQSVSEINVQVDLNESDPDEVLQEVRRALDRVTDLPVEVTEQPLFEELKSGSFPVMEVSLYGAASEIELSEQARFFENQLEKLPGVARVDVFGERDREWHILVRPEQLSRYRISLMDVNAALSGRNVNVPGGVLEAQSALNIRTSGQFTEIDELGALPVQSNETGSMIRLREIARFQDTYERPQFMARTNGENAINLLILKKERADVLELVDTVRERLTELDEQSDVQVSIVEDLSRQTRRQLNVVTNNAAIGLVLVVAILLFFLSTRMAIITSLSLPLVLGATLIIFPIKDISFNMVSMMGMIIALGMLVDNSIVIAENVYRYREDGLSPVDAAVKGSAELVVPILGSFLTTAAAFLPMMFMSGLMGKFVWQIPFVVITVLTASLFESFFLLPARIAHYGGRLKRPAEQSQLRRSISGALDRLTLRFGALVERVVQRPFLTLAILSVILFVALARFATMSFVLFPKEEVEEFLIKLEFAPALRVTQTMNRAAVVEQMIRDLPSDELVSYSMKGGIQQRDANDPLQRVGEHLAMVRVFLTPEVERSRTAEAIIADLEPRIRESLPDLTHLEIEELVPSPPIGAAITVAVEGPEYDVLRQISQEIQDLLHETAGIKNISDDYKFGREELIVRLQQERAALVGVRTDQVSALVRTAFEGSEVSTMRRGLQEITLRVLYDDAYRARADSIGNIAVPNRVGLQTPLREISTTERVVAPESLSHYNYERAVVVTADVEEDVITSNDANALIFEKFGDIGIRYPGYNIALRGEQEDTNESMASLGRAGILAMFAIFAILAVIFSDVRKPLLILATIPLGLVGIAFGFTISNKAMSFLAMIGTIGLAGVQVNASIMIVTFIQQHQADGGSPYTALVNAAVMRFRPILLTTLTTMGGLFPTAYSLGGSDPMLIPITLALAWGLAFGTLGSLIFTPASFAAYYRLREMYTQWRGARRRA
ncbi:MAG: efflux RND transporter permease subunit [Leptospiraceae bacterium]|nr:efflux RND transporter permease subunit [Leptospiraceae bacterium]MCP5485044.1 efflux RND transporter permease subunit [Spirochaetales bacterium]